MKFKVDEDWRNDTNITMYSNSDSYQKLEDFLNAKKTDKVLSFKIEHRASKEQNKKQIVTKLNESNLWLSLTDDQIGMIADELTEMSESKAENLPISDVVLLSSLDVGDRFAIEDEEDIIGDDYYEVLGKSTTSVLCKKPSGRNDRYFPETRVKRI